MNLRDLLPEEGTRRAIRFRALQSIGVRVVGPILLALLTASGARAQDVSKPESLAQQGQAADTVPTWQYGAFLDVGYLGSSTEPANHLFRNRGTTPRVDEWDVNMTAVFARKMASNRSRFGMEATVQTGDDSKIFGFSATAPTIDGAEVLLHFGPLNASYLAPVGKGLTIQGGIFTSLVGYDSLYAKDNLSYTRPWGADYTPYLMLGVNASYPITDRVTATAGVINGYWHLAHANDAPTIVGQLAYRATEHVSVKETGLYGSHQANTDLAFWRFLSDTIVERKSEPMTIAFEYQISTEQVDATGKPLALWTSAQLTVHWVFRAPWSVTVRPEFAWDRDGRWISGRLGSGQSVRAVTTTLEYRTSRKAAQAILRLEHRYDDSRGPAGGFFDGADTAAGVPAVTPNQHILIGAVIVTFDRTFLR
jgi:Putative beta-barrel porin-2, OmpL-like. bbp2